MVLRLLLLLVTLMAAPAWAASVLPLDVPSHLADATLVVEARVGAAQESLDPATSRPVTDTTLSVLSVLAGTAPKALRVRQHKGTAGELSYGIPGDGDLVEGQRVIVFLTFAEGRYWLTALGQSVFVARGDGEGASLTQQLDGLAFFQRDGAGFTPSDPPAPPASVGALRAEVKAAGEGR